MSPSDRPKPPSAGQPPDLPDPDDPPSDEERRAAETLRRSLEGERANDAIAATSLDPASRAQAELAQAVRAVASPESISPARHQQILDRALAAVATPQGARRGVVTMRPRKSKVAYFALGGAASVLALAAAVTLVIRGAAPDGSMASKALAERGPALALSRSTAELFPEGIPRSGGTTHRVDRIAYARAQDFRQNQFARWGAP